MSPYIVVNDGMVENITMFDTYEDANRMTRNAYGSEAFAAEYRYSVKPGDKFRDGWFWNVDAEGKETKAEYIPTEKEMISQLASENEMLTLAMAELIGGGSGAE